MKKYFDCPLCGAKNQAYRSETYPEVVVHKCDNILLEVGHYRNGQLERIPSSQGRNNKKVFLETNQFFIREIIDIDELQKAGATLNNATSLKENAIKFNAMGKILIVEEKRESYPWWVTQVKYMILIQNKKIPGQHFFSGKNVDSIPEKDGIEILKELIKHGLINENPFPEKYVF